MRVEQVMRLVAFASGKKPDQLGQHVRETVAGHCPIGAALRLEIEEHAAIAAENGERPQLSGLLHRAKLRNLLKTRPVLMLQHQAGGMVGDDLGDHAGCDHRVERQRIVLQHPRHVFTNRFHGACKIIDGLVVGLGALPRRDHHACGTHVHGGASERPHGGETGRRHADDDRHLGTGDHPLDDRPAFIRLQLRRLSHNAENGNAGAAALLIEIGQPIDGIEIDRTILVKRCRGNGVDALGIGVECHEISPLSIERAAG